MQASNGGRFYRSTRPDNQPPNCDTIDTPCMLYIQILEMSVPIDYYLHVTSFPVPGWPSRYATCVRLAWGFGERTCRWRGWQANGRRDL